MDKIFIDYLYTKNILVGEQNKSNDSFEVLFSLARFYGIRVSKGHEYATLDLVKYLGTKLYSPAANNSFYKGFPESVLKLTKDEYLFDQVFSYYKTYGLGLFGNSTHSIMEENFIRLAFNENLEERIVEIITEEEAFDRLTEIVINLLKSSRPLSGIQYEIVLAYINIYNYKLTECNSKHTLIQLLYDRKDYSLCSLLSLSDVIKLVDFINRDEYWNNNLKDLHFKNKHRKFFAKVLDCMFEDGYINIKECFEKKKIWAGFLHHIHYKPKTELAVEFVNLMRGNTNESAYSEFERHMLDNDIKKAVDSILESKGTTVLLRKLNYVLSRCTSDEDADYVISKLSSNNAIVIIQLLQTYYTYEPYKKRTFVFTKNNKLCVHKETEEEYNKSKSMISEKIVSKLVEKLKLNLNNLLSNKLGSVYVSEEMKNIALPIQETASNGGYGYLPKGSIIHLPSDKKIRAFTYWEKVDDIDLSVIGICYDGSQIEFSWRTMADRNSKAIVYSGDQTSGFNGGSEFFDVDVKKIKKKYNKLKYLVFCNNVYSSVPFSNVVCRAGYMLRDKVDSGEIYEPKTVKSSFVINAESTFAYLFGLDLEKSAFVWLNLSNSSHSIVAGENDLAYLQKYFKATEVINYYTFMEMMATNLVDDPNDASIVVTDAEYEAKEGQELIRSYDFEKILKYIN